MASKKESSSVVAIVGSDSFLRGDALVRVLEPVRTEMGDLGPMRFEGDRAEPADVLDEVRTPSLLGGLRIVIVEDADEFITANRELMERYCSAPVSDSLLILLCNSLPRNTKLYKIIEAHGQIVVCEAPKGPAFGTWISQRASATYGKKIAALAVQSLRRLLGDSPGWIDAELGKLAAYVGTRPEITVADVNELTDQRREELVFGIIDAMSEGDAAKALSFWDQVMATDRAAQGRSIGGLAWKIRQMIEYGDARISKRQLLDQQRDLLRAELAVKTGLSSLPLAIEQFIVKHTMEPTPKAREARRA
jgi:DNA polymerase-3 subunit delta